MRIGLESPLEEIGKLHSPVHCTEQERKRDVSKSMHRNYPANQEGEEEKAVGTDKKRRSENLASSGR